MDNKINDSFPNETILLGCTNGLNVGPLNNIPSSITNPISLGSITVDTKDLCTSSILVTFTGEISANLQLSNNTQFRILRNCDNSRNNEIVRIYSLGLIAFPVTSESFSFSYCDENICCDCISYSLEMITGPIAARTNLIVQNVVISAKEINHVNSCDYNTKIISNCLTNSTTPIINVVTPTQLYIPISIGSITINTKGLCNPKILLNFSGEISTAFINQFALLAFRVTRTCNNITTQVSGSVGRSIILESNNEFFSYQICDCPNCLNCDCITYNIELLPDRTFGLLSILNFLITAYSVESNSSIINCSKGEKISFTSSSSAGDPITVKPISIGNISVDLSKYSNPSVLITFTGDIATLSPAFVTEINAHFKVTRICNGKAMQIPTDFTALSIIPTGSALALTEAFSYQLCDDDIPCNCDCITYVVEFFSRAPIAPTISYLIDNVVISSFVKNQC